MPKKTKRKFSYDSFHKVCRYRLSDGEDAAWKPFKELKDKGHDMETGCQMDSCPLLWEERAAALGEIGPTENICVVVE